MLYLNKKLFQFKKCVTPLCWYCKNYYETPLHIFWKCEFANFVWNELIQYFKGHVRVTPLNQQTAVFGLLGMDEEKNNILLLFKRCVYNPKSTGTIILNVFQVKLSKIKHIEEIASSNINKKLKQYEKK